MDIRLGGSLRDDPERRANRLLGYDGPDDRGPVPADSSNLVAFGGTLWVAVAVVAIANGGRLTRAEGRAMPQRMVV